MSEEVLGMDVTQPLAFERTTKDCVNCEVAPMTEGMTSVTAEGNRDLTALLSKNELTDNDIAVEQVAPFDIAMTETFVKERPHNLTGKVQKVKKKQRLVAVMTNKRLKLNLSK